MKNERMLLGKTVIAVVLFFCLFLAMTARAELQVNGNLVYDTITNRTWLKDANYAKTSGYHATGLMTWSQARAFITSLNNASYGGHSDWRLPSAKNLDNSGPNYGYNCATDHDAALDTENTEHGSLWFNYSVNSTAPSPFINLIDNLYWTDTEVTTGGTSAYMFRSFPLVQRTKGDGTKCDPTTGYAWPVRTGTP